MKEGYSNKLENNTENLLNQVNSLVNFFILCMYGVIRQGKNPIKKILSNHLFNKVKAALLNQNYCGNELVTEFIDY